LHVEEVFYAGAELARAMEEGVEFLGGGWHLCGFGDLGFEGEVFLCWFFAGEERPPVL